MHSSPMEKSSASTLTTLARAIRVSVTNGRQSVSKGIRLHTMLHSMELEINIIVVPRVSSDENSITKVKKCYVH
jgi:hypothetical protein